MTNQTPVCPECASRSSKIKLLLAWAGIIGAGSTFVGTVTALVSTILN